MKPDLFALNEVWLPTDAGRWLQETAEKEFGIHYTLVLQPKTAAAPHVETEAVLTRFPLRGDRHLAVLIILSHTTDFRNGVPVSKPALKGFVHSSNNRASPCGRNLGEDPCPG